MLFLVLVLVLVLPMAPWSNDDVAAVARPPALAQNPHPQPHRYNLRITLLRYGQSFCTADQNIFSHQDFSLYTSGLPLPLDHRLEGRNASK